MIDTTKTTLRPQTIEEAAEEYRQKRAEEWRVVADRQRRLGRVLRVLNGRPYRTVMRTAHRVGFCFPEHMPVEPGVVWCQWCGMRGRK